MTATAAFLLAFPAFFSIVNPLGAALIYNEVTTGFTAADRARLTNWVAFYSLLVMLAALWGGSYILNFFGISLGALRLAGGAVVAWRAWCLLNAPEQDEARKTEQAGSRTGQVEDIAFFPLTIPFTAGPGTISVAVALGADRPPSGQGLLGFFIGVTAAVVAVTLSVWVAYRSAPRIAGWMGVTGRRTVSRLMAFLLVCIGVQIMLHGVTDVVETLSTTR
jgi:multiple antibiotic resistance protein